MKNAFQIAEELERPCRGDHRLVVLVGGGRARRAQVCPGELCKGTMFGLKMLHDGRLGMKLIGAVSRRN